MLHDSKLLKKTAKIKKMRTNNAQKDRMVASCLIQVLYRPPSEPLETQRFQGVFPIQKRFSPYVFPLNR